METLGYNWDFEMAVSRYPDNSTHVYTEEERVYTVTLTVTDGTLSSPPSLASVTVTTTGAYQQDETGLLSLEAELADANIPRNGYSWQDTFSPAFSGGRALQATPTTGGAQKNPGYSQTSPQLDYLVNFAQTGVHYVWVRVQGSKFQQLAAHRSGRGEIGSNEDISFPVGASLRSGSAARG